MNEALQFGLKDVIYIVGFAVSFVLSNVSANRKIQSQVDEVKRTYLTRVEFSDMQRDIWNTLESVRSILSDVRDRVSRIEGIVSSQE